MCIQLFVFSLGMSPRLTYCNKKPTFLEWIYPDFHQRNRFFYHNIACYWAHPWAVRCSSCRHVSRQWNSTVASVLHANEFKKSCHAMFKSSGDENWYWSIQQGLDVSFNNFVIILWPFSRRHHAPNTGFCSRSFSRPGPGPQRTAPWRLRRFPGDGRDSECPGLPNRQAASIYLLFIGTVNYCFKNWYIPNQWNR